MDYIDLRSDTVTAPTKAMREAMMNAVVGDDVYGDDPTMKELESYAANLVGKEAALFVPSGTFGNQLSLFTHCKRGDEVILGEDCHIVAHEVGASSVIAGVQLRTIQSNKGVLDAEEIRKRIRKGSEDIHYPSTGLICLENAHSNGRVIPLDKMDAVYKVAKEASLPVHLDGARLFNAASYLNVDVKEITKYCDSVMFCLSKGLCAPVGSIVAGSKEFIEKATKLRKLMGGGLRQSGILAAAGLIALKDMTKRVNEDHLNAIYMSEELRKIDGIEVNEENLHINMVFFKLPSHVNADFLVKHLLDKGIKVNGPENGEMRFVIHYWIDKPKIDFVIQALKEAISM
ncbi:low-specificity L-threonine aldolase [Clostridium sp. 19966]|uniref:low-specificity L-threonine aldolase n=1 Tax=Clostridium sp. 19966 TaxID=2768166 RepID=UPI0028DE80F6|nr:low-specificity L-threonine aldolase [Clostridium sp. 19966]MDT8718746.1 low-specificity L-threonine aldolase [Clostridium sp. 19966]